MGGLVRLCVSLVVIATSFTVGDIINSELKYQYNDYREKRDKRRQEEEAKIVKVVEGPDNVVVVKE